MDIKRLWLIFTSFFPSTLPQGMVELDKWLDDVITLSGLPNNDSMRFTASSMILHVNADNDNKPKRYFAKAMRKAAANQVASYKMQEMKEAQLQKAKAETEAKAKEDAEKALESNPKVPQVATVLV